MGGEKSLVRDYPYFECTCLTRSPRGTRQAPARPVINWIALTGQKLSLGLLPWALPTATMAQAYGLVLTPKRLECSSLPLNENPEQKQIYPETWDGCYGVD
jgi:hypothetical protein